MKINELYEQLNETNDKLLKQTLFTDKCIDLLDKYRNQFIYFTNICKCVQNYKNKLIINDLENDFKYILNERQKTNQNLNNKTFVQNINESNDFNYKTINNNINRNSIEINCNSVNELSFNADQQKDLKSVNNKKRKVETKVKKNGRRSDQIRDAIISGKEHSSHRNNKLIARRQQCLWFECKCKVKCESKFTEEQKKFVFQQFYSFKSHSQQYLYLKGIYHLTNRLTQNLLKTYLKTYFKNLFKNFYFLGLVTPKVEQKSNKYKMFEYFIEVPDVNNKTIREKVCQKAFLNLLALKKSELRKKIQIDRRNSDDNRGKHNNRVKRNDLNQKIING
jgi:hypothetical protein